MTDLPKVGSVWGDPRDTMSWRYVAEVEEGGVIRFTNYYYYYYCNNATWHGWADWQAWVRDNNAINISELAAKHAPPKPLKPGYYWATHSISGERQVVQIGDQFIYVRVLSGPCEITEFKDFKPVTPEGGNK